MKCLECQSENPEGNKFCGECGTKLEKECPSCNSSNPPEFKFCGECGCDLSSSEKPSSVTPETIPAFPKEAIEREITPPIPREGERKHVTVLFSDLSGSYQLTLWHFPHQFIHEKRRRY